MGIIDTLRYNAKFRLNRRLEWERLINYLNDALLEDRLLFIPPGVKKIIVSNICTLSAGIFNDLFLFTIRANNDPQGWGRQLVLKTYKPMFNPRLKVYQKGEEYQRHAREFEVQKN